MKLMIRRMMLVVLVTSLLVTWSTAQDDLTEEDFFDLECLGRTDETTCEEFGSSAVCDIWPFDEDDGEEDNSLETVTDVDTNTTDDGSGITLLPEEAVTESTVTYRCRCYSENNWERDVEKGICVQPSAINDVCYDLEESVCSVEYSSCQHQTHDPSVMRCQCDDGYLLAGVEGIDYCEKILTGLDTPDCTVCEDNEGQCYERSDDLVDPETLACKCPASKSGDVCDKLHLTVKCDMDDLSMRLCYDPHDPALNYTMATTDHGQDVECQGRKLDKDEEICGGADCFTCPEGSYLLNLPLDEEGRERCGTDAFLSAIERKKYENEVIIREDADTVSDTDIILRTYCDVLTHASLTADFAARGKNGNDRGEFVEPVVTMTIYNRLDKEVDAGVPVMLGDEISISIELDRMDGYSAIKVESCTASNIKKLPHKDAQTAHLFVEGCPADDQEIFTMSNTWTRFLGQDNVLMTGRARAFSFSQGSMVFLHCKVKICVLGMEADCEPETCGGDNKRKKRSIETEGQDAEVSQEILVVDPSKKGSDGFSSGTVAALVAMLLVVVFALVIVSVVLFLRMRRRNKQVDDDVTIIPGPRPQKFGLSRMNPNLRI